MNYSTVKMGGEKNEHEQQSESGCVRVIENESVGESERKKTLIKWKFKYKKIKEICIKIYRIFAYKS